ncbi:DUF302 domain-containing protein [Halobacillus yeomjeoni]|uniref:DUF302 domain-containing protein n=1 Tax=Halobacillus yeomjeoni TaxID=311194 RepID=A0A931HWA5_9BACI|nr:DUF302 domain-containing protein [Halobacillus yeomjeoni]MBH0230351.1 DUF302 domain-containing protein [Halobacillus yeomjeoni]MCA0984786.1 DUF302 domain-containing protein [Halobacillus yeomjeoni]
MFDYTVETGKNVDEAVESLEANLMEEKFGVLWAFDIKDKLHEKGLEFDKDFKVLEVCNPKEAQRVLNENTLAGYFLPCKIVVYNDDGTTKIGMPKPTSLIQMVEDENIQDIAKDIEHRLIQCIDQSV